MTRRNLCVVVALGCAAWLYWSQAQAPKGTVMPVPCANIVTGCRLPERGLTVSFDRRPQAMQPFRLRVEVPQARSVHASFAMRDMQMGLNRYRLLAGGGGAWTGQVILPVCVQGRSDWVMMLDVDGRQYQLAFEAGSS